MNDHHYRHSVSVAGVIVDDRGRALLIRRRDNAHWEPPGGVLESSEGIDEGVCREVKEETGLDVRPVVLTGAYKNIARGVVSLVFRCEAIAGELMPNAEVSAFHWATAEEVVSMVDEAFAVRVLDALQGGSPAVRKHDGVKVL